nr:hypothetical protein C4D60_Mb08t08760 [Ipomoea trifida]
MDRSILAIHSCDIGTVDGDQITPSFWHQCHQNLVLTFQPQVLKQLRDRHAKSRLLGFSRGPTLMHMWQANSRFSTSSFSVAVLATLNVIILSKVVGKTSVDGGRRHILESVPKLLVVQTILNLNLDWSIGFVIEEELRLEPIRVGDILTFPTQSLPNAPHAIHIGMEAIKHGIPSGGIEVTHILIMRSPGVTHPSVDGVVGDVLDGPHAGTGEPGFSANGVAEEQQRTRRVGHHLPIKHRSPAVILVAERVVQRLFLEDLRKNHALWVVPVPDKTTSEETEGTTDAISFQREEEPVEVDLIGLAGELISAIAVSAVDLSLIVEASLISVGKILHFLNGGLELLHVLVVYGVSGRPHIKLGKTGDLIVLNTTSIRDGRATRRPPRPRRTFLRSSFASERLSGFSRPSDEAAHRILTSPLRLAAAPLGLRKIWEGLEKLRGEDLVEKEMLLVVHEIIGRVDVAMAAG